MRDPPSGSWPVPNSHGVAVSWLSFDCFRSGERLGLWADTYVVSYGSVVLKTNH